MSEGGIPRSFVLDASPFVRTQLRALSGRLSPISDRTNLHKPRNPEQPAKVLSRSNDALGRVPKSRAEVLTVMANQSDPELSRYISLVQSVPRLTREDESELCRRYYDLGDSKARETLVRSHLRYVVAIALKYRRYGLPLADLIAEGNFGVVHALGKFEKDRGIRFVTYAAYWIRAYILNYIIRSWSLVGVGSGALRSKMMM